MVYWFNVKVAVTLESEVILNMQSPVPVQLDAEPVSPDQPVKVESASAAPCRVILVPFATPLHVPVLSTQVNVQPVAVIEPLPVPDLVIVRVLAERLLSSFETKTSIYKRHLWWDSRMSM
jgi:hypothetical protein